MIEELEDSFKLALKAEDVETVVGILQTTKLGIADLAAVAISEHKRIFLYHIAENNLPETLGARRIIMRMCKPDEGFVYQAADGHIEKIVAAD